MIAVIGRPFTRAEIASLRHIGAFTKLSRATRRHIGARVSAAATHIRGVASLVVPRRALAGERGFVRIPFGPEAPRPRIYFTPEELAKAGYYPAPRAATTPVRKVVTVKTESRQEFEEGVKRILNMPRAPERSKVTTPQQKPSKPLTIPGTKPLGQRLGEGGGNVRFRLTPLPTFQELILGKPGETAARDATIAATAAAVAAAQKQLPAEDAATVTRLVTKTEPLTRTEAETLTKLLTKAKTVTRTEADTATRVITQSKTLTNAETGALTRLLAKTRTQALTRTETATLTKLLTQTRTLTKTETQTVTKLLTRTRPLTASQEATLTRLLNKTWPVTTTTTASEAATKAKAATRTGTATKAKAATRTGTATKVGTATRTGTATKVGTTPRTPKVPLLLFSLPGGTTLPAGQFPKVIQFGLGIVDVTQDLQTGQVGYQKRARPAGPDPSKTFRVVSISKRPPRARVIPQGIVDINVTERSLTFKPRPERSIQPPRVASRHFARSGL